MRLRTVAMEGLQREGGPGPLLLEPPRAEDTQAICCSAFSEAPEQDGAWYVAVKEH